MHWIDLSIFIAYMIGMLGVGAYFLNKNKDTDDYYVGGRKMGALHVGLSVVATDVGGGFSIGLGGLGFTMGIAGSWMLFTGLIGAWLAAVFLIPKVADMAREKKLQTFPQIFLIFYDKRVALGAGIISGIGYLGFTSSQILAGAKLAAATFVDLNIQTALIVMGVIAVGYTVMGGLKAVIYTDTFQWAILMAGLTFIGIPMAYNAIGGMEALRNTVHQELLSLGNIEWYQLVNWGVTIIPIWFVGMTLYQRIYSCKGPKQAKRAWFLAGVFEWPIMAFMGVSLGLFSRVAVDQGMFTELGYSTIQGLDSEMGLPMLLRTILPVGLMGLMMSAYFSAILSTADSCLMAASGNLLTDVLGKYFKNEKNHKKILRYSQYFTLGLGTIALIISMSMENVLDLMLLSYAFMVSGLLVPVLGAFFWKRRTSIGALWAMILGGTITATLESLNKIDSESLLYIDHLPLNLDPNIFGISVGALIFIIFGYIKKK